MPLLSNPALGYDFSSVTPAYGNWGDYWNIVDKNGYVGKVKVIRSVDKDLDKEAVRVCKTLPKFTPGRQNGKVVDVWYTVPVTFKLP